MEAILGSPDNLVQGFLAAGHVCTVMGYWEYEPLAEQVSRAHRGHRLRAAGPAARHLPDADGSWRRGAAAWRTSTARAVTREGNQPAQRLIQQVFEVCDRAWRGIGVIPQSG